MSYETYLVFANVTTLALGFIGASWCANKHRCSALGFFLGVGLGPLGLMVIAFLGEGTEEPTTTRSPGWLTAATEAPAPTPAAPVVSVPKTWWKTGSTS